MSRYRRSTNDFGDDLAYGDAPNRWDRDRFESVRVREADRPGRTEVRVTERFDRIPASRGYEERDIYEEEDRYVRAPPRGQSRPRRSDRELFGEEDPREIAEKALAPYRRQADVERDVVLDLERRRVREDYPPPPRPGLLRRQSSLDTFDRRPRRYDDDYRMPANMEIPLPMARGPSMVRRRLREEDFEQIYPEDYRDVEIVREREVRRRERAPSDVQSRRSKSSKTSKVSKASKAASKASKAKSVVSSVSSSRKSSEESESSSEESFEEISRASSPSPERLVGKKGRTRMPKRLVKQQVLLNLNYPFIDEEDFLVVTRALDKNRIDEVIRLSEEYREPATKTYRFEETIPNEHYEALRTEWINPPSIRGPPTVRAPSPARSSRTRQASPARTIRAASRAPSPPRREEIIIRQEAPMPPPPIVYQVPAPAPVYQTPAPPQQPMTVYYNPESREKSEAELRAEIRALEAEQRALKYEREAPMYGRQELVVRSRPEEYNLVEYRPKERERVEVVEPPRNVVRIEKDRKERKGPNPKLVAAMMATLT